MVLNSAIDSKEEGAEIPKRKGMETMKDKPEESPSLSSKTSGAFPEGEFPPQNIVMWMMVSVAVGLLTIYTMVNWISNKLAEEAKAVKKTDKQIEELQETSLENISEIESKHDTLTHNKNILCHRNLSTPEKVALITEKSPDNISLKDDTFLNCDENLHQCDSPKQPLLMSETCEADKMGSNNLAEKPDEDKHPIFDAVECQKCLNIDEMKSVHMEQALEEMKDFVQGNRTAGECLVDVDVKSRECAIHQSNDQTTSVHVGPEFSGNLNFCSEESELRLAIQSTDVTNSYGQSKATIDIDNSDIDTNPQVTINYSQNKSSMCTDKIPNTSVGIICSEKPFTNFDRSHSIAAVQQLPSNTTWYEGTANLPPASTIKCVKTVVKSLSCEASVPHSVPTGREFSENEANLSECSMQKENCQATFYTTSASVSKDSSNSNCMKVENEGDRSSPPSVSAQNIGTSDTKTISDSLNYLTNYHTPQEPTDGSVLSKETSSEDLFMFQQDNGIETPNEIAATNCPKDEDDLETRRSKYLRYIREDPVLSKSLDSQIESLRKGCKLLEKKPLKSSLSLPKNGGSEGSLVDQKKKKFVHFPPDIRNIRKVFKYHSFDEGFYADDSPKCDEKRRTQSFNN
ncbi:uncharacterized protein LOC114529097 [Dendronephthya gigantea]|uniref:uncharacterized protein LOC114529097 n=1 Tax=Dendronephthya gigantea TaxID=151771 RepID=UPI00106AD12D|nr:uncharacterized protein LOC114529097 [Dendronephthya gigantea]